MNYNLYSGWSNEKASLNASQLFAETTNAIISLKGHLDTLLLWQSNQRTSEGSGGMTLLVSHAT